MSKSQQLIDSKLVLYTTFPFLVSLFRSADKIYEDDAVVHLVLLPHPCHVSTRIFVPFAILHAPIYRPPPPLRPILGEEEVGPSRGHVFGWRGERGETGVTPPHAGWPRMQKILVFVMLIPHMQNSQGQNHPCFFVPFFIMSQS
jgi:hypothetical protein